MLYMKLEYYIKDLFKLLSIPSISAQKEHKVDILKAANWLQEKISSLGFKSEVLATKGHPVVYAELLSGPNTHYSQPTILIYGHYDVQSEDPLGEWSSEPFKPEIRSGNIYGRGVADDKGQLYTWIAALEELKVSGYKLKVNLKFLIEGEEELGSENLTDFINDNKSLLKADVCVISDSHCLSETQPLIEYGLRGLVYTEVMVAAFPKDIHSGLYGGNVINPIQVLSEMISKLKDENFHILIPEFYENVRKLDRNERQELAKVPFGEKQIIEETGAKVIWGERDYTINERAGARPTLEINGIWGGYQGEGPKTIIPGTATAKISMRIVPHQKPDEIFEKFNNYIKSITPAGVEVECKLLSTSEPVIVNTKSIFFQRANEAYLKTFGNKPIYSLSGGTIGIVADLKNTLNMDSILMGYGLPDDGLHSPNEKISLSMFEKGILTNIEFLKNIS